MNVRMLVVLVAAGVAAYVAAAVTASLLVVWASVVADDAPDA